MTSGNEVALAGFPARPQATAIPNVFLSDLLPSLAGDAAALGVALYAFAALQRKKGFPRFITAADVAAEPGATAYLAAAAAPADAIDAALRRAVDLGALLPLAVDTGAGRRDLYFLNAPADRRALEAARTGGVDLGRVLPDAPAAAGRSSIFALYEQLIGTLSPLVVNDLTEAERLYPAEWLEAAFREAAAQNARSWRYVTRILERWAIEGPDHAKTERDPDTAGDRYLAGKYGRIIRQRLQP